MKENKKRFLLLWLCMVLLAGELLAPGGGEAEAVQATMRDAVFHGRIGSASSAWAWSIPGTSPPWW